MRRPVPNEERLACLALGVAALCVRASVGKGVRVVALKPTGLEDISVRKMRVPSMTSSIRPCQPNTASMVSRPSASGQPNRRCKPPQSQQISCWNDREGTTPDAFARKYWLHSQLSRQLQSVPTPHRPTCPANGRQLLFVSKVSCAHRNRSLAPARTFQSSGTLRWTSNSRTHPVHTHT